MNPHAKLAVFVAPVFAILLGHQAVMQYNEQQADAAAYEDYVINSLENLGVEDAHKSDGKDKYKGDVGNCETTIWAQENDAQFRVADGRGWFGPNMHLVAVVNLDSEIALDRITEFDEAGCFDNP